MGNRGYDPAGEVTPAKINQQMQNEDTGQTPSVVPSETQVAGRGADTPVAYTEGQSTGPHPSGVNVEPSDAQVRGRGKDTPSLA